jgi:hypothetical protein
MTLSMATVPSLLPSTTNPAFQRYVTTWGQLPLQEVSADPFALLEVRGEAPVSSPKDHFSRISIALGSVEAYLHKVQGYEGALWRALDIDPEMLRPHLDAGGSLPSYLRKHRQDWLNGSAWSMRVNDDLLELSSALAGAGRQLTGRQANPGRKHPNLDNMKSFRRLQDGLVKRIQLAQTVTGDGTGAGLNLFFDVEKRELFGIMPHLESFHHYHGREEKSRGLCLEKDA